MRCIPPGADTMVRSDGRGSCKCTEWERVDSEIGETGIQYHYLRCKGCYRTEYPHDQAKILADYAKDNQFMFLNDWILATLYALEGIPIVGIEALQMQMFITVMEFAQENGIPSEAPGFDPYSTGPYSERVDETLYDLQQMGYVRSMGGRVNGPTERFELSERGMEAAKRSFEKLTDEQRARLIDLSKDYVQMGAQGLWDQVNGRHPDYTDASVKFKRTFHRHRR